MCQIVELPQISLLKEVEYVCSLFYEKSGSNKLITICNDNDSKLVYCTLEIFENINSENVYLRLAKKYVRMQHEIYKCGIKSFINLLGYLLMNLIPIFEEARSRRYFIVSIREVMDMVAYLYKISTVSIKSNIFESIKVVNKPVVPVTSQSGFFTKHISKLLNFSVNTIQHLTIEEGDVVKNFKTFILKSCHSSNQSMQYVIWKIVKETLLSLVPTVPELISKEEQRSSIFQFLHRSKSQEETITLTDLSETNVNELLSNLINLIYKTSSSSSTEDLSHPLLEQFKLGLQYTLKNALFTTIITYPNEPDVFDSDGTPNFILIYGLLLEINEDGIRLLEKTKQSAISCNSVLLDCDVDEESIMNRDYMKNETFQEWSKNWLNNIEVECIFMSGKCDSFLMEHLQNHRGILVIHQVDRNVLISLSKILNTTLNESPDSQLTICQLKIEHMECNHRGVTKNYPLCSDSRYFCVVQIPEWMNIFGVSTNKLHTLVVRHSTLQLARAIYELFLHNFERVKNSLVRGSYFQGAGSLEKKIAHEIRARANDKLKNLKRDESVYAEEKCMVMYAVAKAFDMFRIKTENNLYEYSTNASEMTYDDPDSKIGAASLLGQCLATLFSTDIAIHRPLDNI